MTKQVPWFVAERAEWYASLVLTKRHDVKVQPCTGRDKAVDLLVEVLDDGKPTLRFFGVQIVPYMDLPDIPNGDKRVLSNRGRDLFEAALPLCVFVVGVRKPEGLYRWAVEPVVDDGRAVLHRAVEANWQPLDEEGAACLIGQVKAWYDALNGGSTPKRRGRHSKTESR
jgi:hypothetical protein